MKRLRLKSQQLKSQQLKRKKRSLQLSRKLKMPSLLEPSNQPLKISSTSVKIYPGM